MCHSGYWGDRVTDIASRFTSDVVQVRTPYGTVFPPEQIIAAIKKHQPKVGGSRIARLMRGVQCVFIVHGESSTGTMQPLDGIGAACREVGCLLIVDTVCTLVGAPLFVDAWGIDIAYSGSQKCLRCVGAAGALV